MLELKNTRNGSKKQTLSKYGAEEPFFGIKVDELKK